MDLNGDRSVALVKKGIYYAIWFTLKRKRRWDVNFNNSKNWKVEPSICDWITNALLSIWKQLLNTFTQTSDKPFLITNKLTLCSNIQIGIVNKTNQSEFKLEYSIGPCKTRIQQTHQNSHTILPGKGNILRKQQHKVDSFSLFHPTIYWSLGLQIIHKKGK